MRRLLLTVMLLLPASALAQSVPNPETPITQGIVWTPQQWINAWQSKVDVTNGALNNPTISGGTIDNTPIGQVTPSTGVFTFLTASTQLNLPLPTSGGVPISGAVPVFGAAFFGDTTHIWGTGANWGFGNRPTSNTGTVNVAPTLTVQRVPAYTGAVTGNPSALSVINTIGGGVTGGESGIALTMNDSGTGGVHVGVQLGINKLAVGTTSQFGTNIVATDKTGRKSSVAGSLIGTEFDIIAAGPDDQFDRVNLDLIVREYPGGSADGPTVHTIGGARARGQSVQGGAAGVINTPSSMLYGFRTQTITDIGNVGDIASVGTSFGSDGATTAGFSAISAVQTQVTNASALSGATTLTLATTNDKLTGYIWPGALVTGTNIAPNTHVVTQSYDANVTITITIDTPTSGPIANGATLTFTNAINNAFTASGYLTGNVYSSPGFSVDPVGNVTANSIAGVSGASNAATGRIGEYVSASAANNTVSLATGTPSNVTSISLTAGDWDVSGVALVVSANATHNSIAAGLSSTSATLPVNTSGALTTLNMIFSAAQQENIPAGGRTRFSLASTTTIYLVVQASFSGTSTAGGFISARRVR